MKKVIESYSLVAIGNEKFQRVSIWDNITSYKEPKGEKVIVLDTFKKAYGFIEDGNLLNAWVGTTFFRKKPYIKIHIVDFEEDRKMTEKNFQPIKFKFSEHVVKRPTMEYLMKKLPAEEFAEWLKDNGIEGLTK